MAKYTSHKISCLYHFSVYSSIALDSFTLLCDQFPELFSALRTETLGPWNSNSPFLLSPAPRNQLLLSVSISLTALGASYKWNHTALVFLFHVACLHSSSTQLVSEFLSFLRLNNIPLCVYTTYGVSVWLLMDTWFTSTFWLMLLWTWGYKNLLETPLSVL